ncbi:hypothetical protein L228DRAFT_260305 [Xylona heveae TC161]|uniref:Uncharacterized protein n=1 Tax=Xylona heveae (strain CBS 132557 / TC161) TaxID=1328760 RepID=A0A165HGM7_XYLHT|nr:hypothetical protein L228DRAFT_260305 [Xylona heveae TC161]KZF23484.1 hypothetical protein L228DRAFT_260305 [Xylona heveae TC161]
MAVLNPLYAVFPGLLFILALPLMGFAVVTSVLAFSTLSIRAIIVYIEMGMAFIHNFLFSSNHKSTPYHPITRAHPHSPLTAVRLSSGGTGGHGPAFAHHAQVVPVLQHQHQHQHPHQHQQAYAQPHAAGQARQPRRKKRRSSTSVSDQGPSMTIPLGATTPGAVGGGGGPGGGTNALNLDRDFEGMGGWRYPDAPEDDRTWSSFNSRLELPALALGERTRTKRNHNRSLTSGSLPTPYLRRSGSRSGQGSFVFGSTASGAMSPGNNMPLRTPPIVATSSSTLATPRRSHSPEEYFSLQHHHHHQHHPDSSSAGISRSFPYGFTYPPTGADSGGKARSEGGGEEFTVVFVNVFWLCRRRRRPWRERIEVVFKGIWGWLMICGTDGGFHYAPMA